MELPKNITQIGEVNRNCKIYVEDYVISYIKQMNQLALNKEMAVALYGTRKDEGDITYLFLYGAGKLDFIQREVRHLSQAQQQEIEKVRRKYFEEFQFQGYCLLDGEMVEGFHISEQGTCRYITGYAQFYEKNDSMLAYMLDVREQEASPEVVNQEKYEMVRKRQEERRAQQSEENFHSRERTSERHVSMDKYTDKQEPAKVIPMRGHAVNRMKLATVAVFAVLCLVGLSALGGEGGTKDIQEAARQVMSSLTEQKLPDAETPEDGYKLSDAQTNTLIAEDKLTEALQQENAALLQEQVQNTVTEVLEPEAVLASEAVTAQESVLPEIAQPQQVEAVTEPETVVEPEVIEPDIVSEPEIVAQQEVVVEQVAEPEAYTIRQGDTLIGISVNRYGSDSMVQQICSMNQIADPDDIKIGQKILLP